MERTPPEDPFVAGTRHLATGDRERVLVAARDLADALGSGGHQRVLDAAEALDALLAEHDLDALRVHARRQAAPSQRQAARAGIEDRLATELASDDPDVRGQALWTLGSHLQHMLGEPAAAADAYRAALAMGRTAVWAVAAATNLAGLLEADGDLQGARRAYEFVVEHAPRLDDPAIAQSLVHEIAAGRLADLDGGSTR